MKMIHKIMLCVVLSVVAVCATAGRTMVTARLDSASIMMGSVSPLHIEVVQDEDLRGEFPLFSRMTERGYVTLLNDTVEISPVGRPDTVKVGSGRIQINYEMLVQSFDSGLYRIPGLQYVVGGDTVSTDAITLKVVPVNVTAEDPISPMTTVQEPEDPSIFDSLPDWLVKWWWLLIAAVAVAFLTWYGIRRFRKTGSLLPPKPETPAHLVALERLRRLKARKLCESGREKEYYTLLTDILRTYLEKRFGIKAMEMTSRQIMSTLADDESLKASRGMMRQILDVADFVKFARVRPLPDDNVKAYDNAVRFVEDTAPREEENVNPEGEENRASEKKGGKA